MTLLSAYKVSACRGLLRDGAAAGIAVVSRLVVRSVWYGERKGEGWQ